MSLKNKFFLVSDSGSDSGSDSDSGSCSDRLTVMCVLFKVELTP